jgi:hypothetical protein
MSKEFSLCLHHGPAISLGGDLSSVDCFFYLFSVVFSKAQDFG